MYIYIYICIHACICVPKPIPISLSLSIYMYIYIYSKFYLHTMSVSYGYVVTSLDVWYAKKEMTGSMLKLTASTASLSIYDFGTVMQAFCRYHGVPMK